MNTLKTKCTETITDGLQKEWNKEKAAMKKQLEVQRVKIVELKGLRPRNKPSSTTTTSRHQKKSVPRTGGSTTSTPRHQKAAGVPRTGGPTTSKSRQQKAAGVSRTGVSTTMTATTSRHKKTATGLLNKNGDSNALGFRLERYKFFMYIL